MDFADLLNLNKKQEEKKEEPKAEAKKPQGSEVISQILPHLLKNSNGAQDLMPLLSMLGGGEPDYGKLLNLLMKQNREPKKKEEPEKQKSKFDDYTTLE